MRKLILYLLLYVCTASAYAQPIDSIEKKLLGSELSDTERIDQQNLLSRELTYVNPIRSIEIAKMALESASKGNYEKGKAYAYRNLAGAYSYYGSFYLTIDNMQKALTIFERLNDSAGVANCKISLGHTYRRLRNRAYELEYHKEAYEIFSRLNVPERIGVTAHNLGETYFNIGDLDKSLELTQKAIVINDSLKNLSVLSACYKVMGNIFMQREELEKAETNFLKVLAISEQLGENSQKIATIEAMIQLAVLYDLRKEQDKKLEILNKAADFVKENKLTDYVGSVYIKLVEEYIKRNNQRKALEIITAFKTTQDSLTKIQLEDRNRLTLGFIQLFEMEKKNTLLSEENQQQLERIRTRNILVSGAAIFMLVLISLLFLLFRNIRKLKKTNRLLVEQDRVITSQNTKLAELNATKDKFFSVVSHDMKAPLNSLWSFTNLLEENIDVLQRDQLMELVKELKQHLESTTKMTDNLMTWAKLQMKEMKTEPEMIQVNDILNEVSNLYQEILQSKQITLINQLPAGATVWADNNQVRFILRNLVNNAIKYSPRGAEIKITGEANDNYSYSIKVADSGKGIQEAIIAKLFTTEPIHSARGTAGEQGSGLGLKLCHEFTILNHGSLMVASKSGQGTVFSLVLPARPDRR